jgi:hypothetical protein
MSFCNSYRLKESHTGEYMAQLIFDCLVRFKIEEKVHFICFVKLSAKDINKIFSICMDNAANCDKLAIVLGNKLPKFEGTKAHI